MRLLSADDAETHWAWAKNLDYGPLDKSLREMATRGAESSELIPLLTEDESVNASCYFDGYFTFATDSEAADVMFADEVPMKELRASYLAGEEHTHDLTLIRGRNLLHASSVSASSTAHRASLGRKAVRYITELNSIVSDEIRVVDVWICENFNLSLEASAVTEDGRRYLLDSLNSIRRTVSVSLDFLLSD